ncbi:ribonuclease T2-like [Thelotrema lepadinum]|nr:ribonuclease T2-like [Thelotrema lepadinum]
MAPASLIALATASIALLAQGVYGQSESCPVTSSTVQSCQNTTKVANTCCFNSPGGQLLQTQFWDDDPATGPSNSWTIHGLWPDECSGSYQENCDSRTYDPTTVLQDFGANTLLSYMNTYWKNQGNTDEELWEHEWETHGTCISTFKTDCYTNYKTGQELVQFYNTTVNLFKTLPTYTWLSGAGITPSTSKTYTKTQILNVLTTKHGAAPVIQCSGSYLDQVYYAFEVKGSAQTGQFIPVAPTGESSNCPSSGIKYGPKTSSNKKRESRAKTRGLGVMKY